MGILDIQDDYFGIDIGSTGIRAVQLKKSSGNPALVAYGDIELPNGLTQSDSPIDQDKVAEAVKQLVQQAKITTNKVVAGLQSAQAFATVITTPKLNEKELAGAMKLQADQYIPMAIDQVKLDWHVIGPGKNENEQKVLLVAAPNTVINKYLRIVEKAGLELEALEINAIAFVRSLMADKALAVAIIDVGSIATDITIIHQGVPKLIRSVSTGGSMFMKSVAHNLGLDDEQAEQFTKKFGLTQTKLEGAVYKAIKPSLDLLTDELTKSINYVNTQNEGMKLEKIILTGGTAALPELPTYLANAMGMPVEIGNPWRGVSYPAELQEQLGSNALEYAVAVGLAQRAFE